VQAKTIAAAFSYSMLFDGSMPGLVASTDALMWPRMMSLSWDRGYEGVELFIKPVFDLIRAGQGWGVGTYQGGICLLSKWQLHFHKAIVETLRNAGEFMDVCCCDGKSHSCLLPLFAAASAPKKCVAANSLCQLTFAGEPCLAENRDINFVAIIFLCFDCIKGIPTSCGILARAS